MKVTPDAGGASAAPSASAVAQPQAAAAPQAQSAASPQPQSVAPTQPQAAAQSHAAKPPAARAPAPWEDAAEDTNVGDAAVIEAPPQTQTQTAPAQPAARQAAPVAEDDDLPPWVTDFSDDSAMPAGPAHMDGDEFAAPVARPAQAKAPAKAPYEYVITPVPELDWDGNWPMLAAHLPLRGVSQQLATQAELVSCTIDGNAALFKLRCPIDTWCTQPNIEKLTAALSERFGRPARVETETGPVWYTTSAEAQAHREACQRAAEQAVNNDPFVQAMAREFGAFVVAGSIVAPVTPAH